MNILIPLAGAAKRFKEAGHTFPKTLVQVIDKPMIQWVIENLSLPKAQFTFVINKSDVLEFSLDAVLRRLKEDCNLILQSDTAMGAACSALLGIEYIDNSDELIIAAGDQYMNCNLQEIIEDFRKSPADAGTITFKSIHPQYSFVLTDEEGWVVEVAEKRPISDNANVGIFWFRHGKDFIESVKMLIRKEDMVLGQYYLAPALNQIILMGKKVRTHPVQKEDFLTFGTPEKVQEYNNKGVLYNKKGSLF